MFEDAFEGYANSPIAPAELCFAITPSDTENLVRATKAIYVGTGGVVSLVPVRGTEAVSFVNVPDGSVMDIRAKAIRATGTTATNIVGLA